MSRRIVDIPLEELMPLEDALLTLRNTAQLRLHGVAEPAIARLMLELYSRLLPEQTETSQGCAEEEKHSDG